MKKLLSSILVFAIAVTSFSAVSCFASESSVPTTSASSTETPIKEEVSSSKEKKVDYLAAKAFVLGFAYFVYCTFFQADSGIPATDFSARRD